MYGAFESVAVLRRLRSCRYIIIIITPLLISQMNGIVVLPYVDAVVDSCIAVIMLQTKCNIDFSLRVPRLPRPTRLLASPHTDIAYDQLSPDVNWKSITTSRSISYESTTSSAQTQAPPWNTETRNDSWQEVGPLFEYVSGYDIIGPMIFVHLSAANTSDAGFTVNLLFQHPSYLEVSLLRFLSCCCFYQYSY